MASSSGISQASENTGLPGAHKEAAVELLRDCLPSLREAPNRYQHVIIERFERAIDLLERNCPEVPSVEAALAYAEGYEEGLRDAKNSTVAELIIERDATYAKLAFEKAVNSKQRSSGLEALLREAQRSMWAVAQPYEAKKELSDRIDRALGAKNQPVISNGQDSSEAEAN